MISVMDRIEVESIIPVPLELPENNSPPSYDAAVKKNNYFPEVLKHQARPVRLAGDNPKNKKIMEKELSFLKLVCSIFLFCNFIKKK